MNDQRCAEDGCDSEVTVFLTLTPRFEADPPIQGWYVDILRKRHPSVAIDFHEDCHLSARIEACDRHIADLATCWTDWLYGAYDPVVYEESCSPEDLTCFGWVVHADGRLEQRAERPGPLAALSAVERVAGGSGPLTSVLSPPGAATRRATRKRDRQNRKRGRR